MHQLITLGLTVSLVTACTDADLTWQPLDRVAVAGDHSPLAGTIHAGIVGGAPHAGNPEVALLVALDQAGQAFSICSSTLVGPRLLLTAAHCVDDRVGAAGFAAYFGTDARVENDPGFVFVASADALAIHPAWNPDDLAAGNDIAVVRLTADVPIATTRVRTAPLSAAELGAPIELVGWGVTGSGLDDNLVKRRVASQIFELDAKLVTVGDAKAGICFGDSGGPAFLAGRVFGVSSFTVGECTIAGVDTRVDRFLDFLGAAGVDVSPDPDQPPPSGDEPAQPDDGCSSIFGCGNAPPTADADREAGGCSAGRGSIGFALVLLGLALAAGRRPRSRSGQREGH